MVETTCRRCRSISVAGLDHFDLDVPSHKLSARLVGILCALKSLASLINSLSKVSAKFGAPLLSAALLIEIATAKRQRLVAACCLINVQLPTALAFRVS